MNGQPEITNLLRSLKPFVNKQGVLALDTLENVFAILDDPKMKTLSSNLESFSILRKEQRQKPENTEAEKSNLLHSFLKLRR